MQTSTVGSLGADSQSAREELRAREAWQWLLASETGRWIARTWLRWSLVDQVSPGGDVAAMAEYRGRQMLGHLLRAQLAKHDPAGFLRLLEESMREARGEALRAAAADQSFAFDSA